MRSGVDTDREPELELIDVGADHEHASVVESSGGRRTWVGVAAVGAVLALGLVWFAGGDAGDGDAAADPTASTVPPTTSTRPPRTTREPRPTTTRPPPTFTTDAPPTGGLRLLVTDSQAAYVVDIDQRTMTKVGPTSGWIQAVGPLGYITEAGLQRFDGADTDPAPPNTYGWGPRPDGSWWTFDDTTAQLLDGYGAVIGEWPIPESASVTGADDEGLVLFADRAYRWQPDLGGTVTPLDVEASPFFGFGFGGGPVAMDCDASLVCVWVVRDTAGNEVQRIADARRNSRVVASSDGRVALITEYGRNRPTVRVVGPGGDLVPEIEGGFIDYSLVTPWSADGRWLVVNVDAHVEVIDTQRGERWPLDVEATSVSVNGVIPALSA
jgi:hypothetical protein